MRLSGYFICLLLGSTAESAIYRCDGDFGEPSFSPHPCGGNAVIVTPHTGNSTTQGVGLRASERAWLEQRRRDSRRRQGKKRDTGVSPAAAAHAARKQAYNCRKKRRSLDAVKAKLRRGYKPASGEKLRRRRRDHEDYLAAFCS